MHPGFPIQKAEVELIKLRKTAARNLSRGNFESSTGIGARKKSFADIVQALEVFDVELQKQMATELDGYVMKCIRDQNGNHVIQKCIEYVPQDQVHFIVASFFGHVVSLSTHPYGCRIIQRVLEYCNNPETQKIIMDEILQVAGTLVLDQYGNYVIQHVLQHGIPHERSNMISKLTGQIVKMSLHKYASNVVEKCLIFATPEERQILVNQMLGST